MLLAPGLSHQRADCGQHPLGLSRPMFLTSCSGHCCSQLCSVIPVRPAAPGCRATHQAGDVVEAWVGVGVHDAQGAQVREPRLLVSQDRRPLWLVGVCSASGTQSKSAQRLDELFYQYVPACCWSLMYSPTCLGASPHRVMQLPTWFSRELPKGGVAAEWRRSRQHHGVRNSRRTPLAVHLLYCAVSQPEAGRRLARVQRRWRQLVHVL